MDFSDELEVGVVKAISAYLCHKIRRYAYIKELHTARGQMKGYMDNIIATLK